MTDRRALIAGLALALSAVPALGQAQESPRFVPAPMPNPDVRAPRSPETGDTTVAPRLFMPPDRFAGDGYTPGSTVQSEQERRLRPGAGVNLRMTFD
jgi:hypothetical protein